MNNGDLSAAPFEYEAMGDQGVTYKEQEFGLTKREDIAKAAMQGILADSHIMNEIRINDDIETADFVGGLAVEYADALLAALEKS